MLFLFPRRCIRTRLEFLAKKSRTWRRGRGIGWSRANISSWHTRGTRASSPLLVSAPRRFFHFFVVRRASFGANLRPPVSFETAAAKQLETATRFHPRTSDPSNLNFPLFSAPHPANSFEEKGIEGGRWFCTARKIVFDDRVLTSAQKRKENKEIVLSSSRNCTYKNVNEREN